MYSNACYQTVGGPKMKDIRKPISWGRRFPREQWRKSWPARSRGEYEPVSRWILVQVAAILVHPLPRPICQAWKSGPLDIRRTQSFEHRNIFSPNSPFIAATSAGWRAPKPIIPPIYSSLFFFLSLRFFRAILFVTDCPIVKPKQTKVLAWYGKNLLIKRALDHLTIVYIHTKQFPIAINCNID